MGFEIKKSGSVVLCPSGSHVARCFLVLDIGTHPVEFQGKFAGNQQKVVIGWELPSKLHTFDEKKGQEPFTLSRKFTNSMHEKAGLRALVESWSGKKYSDEKVATFMKAGIKVLIDKTCLINVVHAPRSDGTMRAEIKSIMPIPEGMICPPAIIKPVIYSQEEGRNATFNALAKWQQEDISKCLEWTTKKVEQQDPNSSSEPEPGKESPDEEDPF